MNSGLLFSKSTRKKYANRRQCSELQCANCEKKAAIKTQKDRTGINWYKV